MFKVAATAVKLVVKSMLSTLIKSVVIKNRIKYNLKEIGKYDTKIKGSKNVVEKSLYKTMAESIKQENKFLESLVESEVEKNEKTDSKN